MENKKVNEHVLNQNYVYVKSKDDLAMEIINHGWNADFYDEIMDVFGQFENIDLVKGIKILMNVYPISNVWFIFKLDEIIAELHEVLKECNAHNMRWEWI